MSRKNENWLLAVVVMVVVMVEVVVVLMMTMMKKKKLGSLLFDIRLQSSQSVAKRENN